MFDEIKAYYENYDEEGRLLRDNAHLPEYLTTIRYFDKLFTPGSRILDACAGAGRYAFYLANKGHTVTACDLSQHHVNIIKSNPDAHKLADIAVCNTLDLSRFKDNSFDAVLCMGALYHLRDNQDKAKALSECVRVCKPGGIIAIAYITKIGAILTELNDDAGNIDLLVKSAYGDESVSSIFVCAAPHEIESLAAKYGLKKMHHVGVDVIGPIGAKLNNAGDDDFRRYMEFHFEVCEDPSYLGASIHGLWIGRK